MASIVAHPVGFFSKNFFTYVPGTYNNETYRIDDIDWDRNPTSTFDRRGEQVSLVQYYQEKHNRCVRLSPGP